VLFCIAIAYQIYRSPGIFSLNNNRMFNYLGKISYGLYCFHGLVIAVLMNLLILSGYSYPFESPLLALIVFPVVSLLLTILIGAQLVQMVRTAVVEVEGAV
jgi:peptidoglycan/LPS O-acetylase OafA/YrhL